MRCYCSRTASICLRQWGRLKSSTCNSRYAALISSRLARKAVSSVLGVFDEADRIGQKHCPPAGRRAAHRRIQSGKQLISGVEFSPVRAFNKVVYPRWYNRPG